MSKFDDKILDNPEGVADRIQEQGFEWAKNLLELLGGRLGINVGDTPREDHKVLIKLPDTVDELNSFMLVEQAMLEKEIEITKAHIIELRKREVDATKRLEGYKLMTDSLARV